MMHMQPLNPISDKASSSRQRFSAGCRRRSARLSHKSGTNEMNTDSENHEKTNFKQQSCSKQQTKRIILGKNVHGKASDCTGDTLAKRADPKGIMV